MGDDLLIGVISDTHGLLRSEVTRVFTGVDLIIHAGDVGRPAILDNLRLLAPVRAVRGNTDSEPWAAALPQTTVVELATSVLFVLHDLSQLGSSLATGQISAVIHGHTHRPSERRHDGVLYFNPGSAGPERDGEPPSVGKLLLREGRIDCEIIRLDAVGG